MKLEQEVIVKNPLGLHIRPATCIVKMLQSTACIVSFTHKKMTVNAKSIMSILMLAAKKNSKIKIGVDGEGALQVLEDLVKAFASQFAE